MSEDRHFNADKIFIVLFVLTALEVLWGYAFGVWFVSEHGSNRLMLWGGLLTFAFFKGWYIAVYFMHLKFEGWVVKSLLIPTPFLVMVIFGYVMPDVADTEGPLIHPVGSRYDPTSGTVYEHMEDGPQPAAHGAEASH